MTPTLILIAIVAVTLFIGVVIGYRTGIADGRRLGRYQRQQGWVEDLEAALADTKHKAQHTAHTD